jgi:hypothetical protein
MDSVDIAGVICVLPVVLTICYVMIRLVNDETKNKTHE